MMDWILYVIGGVVGLIVGIWILSIVREIIKWFFGVDEVIHELRNIDFKINRLVNEISEINKKTKSKDERNY